MNLYNINSANSIKKLIAHEKEGFSLARLNNQIFASGDGLGNLFFWNYPNLEKVGNFKFTEEAIFRIIKFEEENKLALALEEGKVIILH